MKLFYVITLVFFACFTVLGGIGLAVYESNFLPMVQSVFNIMLAVGALVSYSKTGD